MVNQLDERTEKLKEELYKEGIKIGANINTLKGLKGVLKNMKNKYFFKLKNLEGERKETEKKIKIIEIYLEEKI